MRRQNLCIEDYNSFQLGYNLPTNSNTEILKCRLYLKISIIISLLHLKQLIKDEKQMYKELNLKEYIAVLLCNSMPQFPHLLNGDNNNLCIFSLGSKQCM